MIHTESPLPDFQRMLLPLQGHLHSFALGFTREEEDADDLVQDTLVKAYSYYGSFQPGTNFKAWLFTIMRNTFINGYKREGRRKKFLTVDEELSSAVLLYSASSNRGEQKFISEDIHRALSTLSKVYYTPFMMYFEGFKYHEIAEELALPIGTVKTRIHGARLHLKKFLKVYGLGQA